MDFTHLLLVIFSTLKMSSIDGTKDESTNYVFTLRRVKKITEEITVNSRLLRTSTICRADEEELERICKVAVRSRKLEKYPIAYDETLPMGEPKVYRLNISYFAVDEIIQACRCPSVPPIYLTDGMPKRKKTHRPVVKVKTKKRKKFDNRKKVAVTLLADKAVTVDGTFRRIIRRCRNKPIRLSRKECIRMEQAIIANCI